MDSVSTRSGCQKDASPLWRETLGRPELAVLQRVAADGAACFGSTIPIGSPYSRH